LLELAWIAEVVMPTRAVLFRFDGVLADTENVHVAAWQRTFRAMGWNESDETCARAAEVDDRAFVLEVFARRKIEGGDAEGWANRKQNLTIQLLRDRPHLQPGVADLIQRLREAGVALAVVTESRRANVEAVLAASGLLDAFDVLVTGNDLKMPKLDLEAYRLAIKRLKVKPGEAVAVEDSATGLVAAQRAGLRVVAVTAVKPAGDWTGDAAWLPNLTDPSSVMAVIGL